MQQENQTLGFQERRRPLNPPMPANISESVSAAAAKPAAPSSGGDDDGSSSSRPKLLLDSGASIHVVGYPRLLSNLHDAPVGMTIRVANGDTLPVTKIGDIQMAAAGFTIPGVHLAPGIKVDVISVPVLARNSICTWFDGGGRATLYAGPKVVGVAVAQQAKNGLYILESFSSLRGNSFAGSMSHYMVLYSAQLVLF